jgi:hypothetical protein
VIAHQQRDATHGESQRQAIGRAVQPAPDETREIASPDELRAPRRDVLARQLARAVQLRVGRSAGPLLMRGPHDKGYYKATGTNGTTYFRFCKKRSDAQETSFKQEVIRLAGGILGSVQYPKKEPTNGVEI